MLIKQLYLLLAATIFAASAAAQSPLGCMVTAGPPPALRAEGVAEEVGQVAIVCTGGTPTAAGQPLPKINIQIFLNTNVTSRLLGTFSNRSEALLLLDEPTPIEQVEAPSVPFTGTVNAQGGGIYKGLGRPNVFGATQEGMNSLKWSNIPFDPPANGQSRVMRLVNIRANAAQLGASGTTNPNPISAFISISGAVSIGVSNSQINVGYSLPGLRFTAAAATYQRCLPGTETYSVSFTELFHTSFRHKSAAGSQNILGSSYNTESMFYNADFTGIGAGAGVATQGTRLSVRFVNVPPNITITVPTTGSSTVGDAAALVASGTDGSTADPATGVVTITGAAGKAVYEVTASNPGAISTLNFAISIAHAASPAPGLGTVTVAGQYAPATTSFVASTEAAPRFIENPTSASSFTMTECTPPVTLSVNRTALAFAATSGATAATPSQEVFLTMAGASNNWTATSNAAWLNATPASGKGSGRFTVGIVPSGLPAPGTHSGTISVNAEGATNGPLSVNCTLIVKASTTAPFGVFETPLDNTTGITGSIAVTGWALDDIGVKQVTIWRDRVGTEPVHSNGLVYIGEALFVPGARPDVEVQYPTNPNANRAGWGYLMLTYGLPAQGNGTFKIHAFAVDQEGNQLKLGTRTITVDNLHSVKPFGALDLPQPGETISGTYPVQGWALAPQPASINANGSTIWVHVDGVNIAHPGPLQFRDDIFAIFPGYANSNASAGSYAFDSTTYANGMHNIAWILIDDLGRMDGIGSRFFHIQNGATSTAAAPEPVQLRAARRQRQAEPETNYPSFRIGYDPDAVLTPVRQAGQGLLEPVELNELDRVELHLPTGQQWSAALRFGDELRDLPIGSTFDTEGGVFYWQLGPGFLGEFTIEFRAADGTVLPISVRVEAR